MGGGTFFELGRNKCKSKKLYQSFVVCIRKCDVANIERWRR